MLHNAEEAGNEFYAGVAKLFLAYNFGNVTDLWGDAPFSEALNTDDDIVKPKYDNQRVRGNAGTAQRFDRVKKN